MKTAITEIVNTGESIKLINGDQWCVEYYDRKKVVLWSIRTDVEVVKEDNLFWPHSIINLKTGEKVKARKYHKSDLVPKNKFDLEAVEKIRGADISQLLPILPELFEWIEDPNWPIAAKLAAELVRLGEYLTPYIKYYLRNPNDHDEYLVIHEIIPQLSEGQIELLKEDLVLFAYYPTEYEKI